MAIAIAGRHLLGHELGGTSRVAAWTAISQESGGRADADGDDNGAAAAWRPSKFAAVAAPGVRLQEDERIYTGGSRAPLRGFVLGPSPLRIARRTESIDM